MDTYVYSGHSVLMGKKKTEWQDVNKVLGMFSNNRLLSHNTADILMLCISGRCEPYPNYT